MHPLEESPSSVSNIKITWNWIWKLNWAFLAKIRLVRVQIWPNRATRRCQG